MSDNQELRIMVVGPAGSGKTSLAILLADFLDHTGFEVEVNLIDPEVFEQVYTTLPDRLEHLIKNRKIVITERLVHRMPSEI